MRRFVRKAAVYVWHTAVCIGGLAVAMTLFWAASYSVSAYRRRRAEQLMYQLAALQPGAPGLHTAQQIAKEFGAKRHCTGDVCTYDFEYGFGLANSVALRWFRTEWDHEGLRPWSVTAQITTDNREVTNTVSGILVGRGRGWLYNEGGLSGDAWSWLMISIASNAGRFEQKLRLDKEYDRQLASGAPRSLQASTEDLIVDKPSLDVYGGGEAIDVYLSPHASPQSRKIAFDLNLHCLVGISRCAELCQIAPSAWQVLKADGWANNEPAVCSRLNR